MLLRETAETCKKINLGLTRFSVKGLECVNGARVKVGSTDEGYQSSEGYTIGATFIDEGHDAEAYWIGKLYPSMKVWIERDMETFIIAGVKGLRESLIEVAWRERGFKLNLLTVETVLKHDPLYQRFLDKAEINMSQEELDKYIYLKSTGAGNRAIFMNIGPLPDFWHGQPHTDTL